MRDSERFGLAAIEAERARIEAAKRAARSPENKRSASRLMALANLPIVIALLVWAYVKFF
ncbi:hypothetical protein [Chitinolyticbacter meiyuanensis]|uniref:hypothetical protein n=1 Tax=Chitinolyticbacter meiyuanensis TaxID=682798 RepID=UPI0011E5B308|nr:hypothetical protein [Chitinolyticbacter meiyuanensis]